MWASPRFLWDRGSGQPLIHGQIDRASRAGLGQSVYFPRAAPSKGAKFCTYHWFGRPGSLHFGPYFELPMSVDKLQAWLKTCVPYSARRAGPWQFARPALPRHLCPCSVCDMQVVGDESHCAFFFFHHACYCAHFSNIKPQFLTCSRVMRGACSQ